MLQYIKHKKVPRILFEILSTSFSCILLDTLFSDVEAHLIFVNPKYLEFLN